MQVPCQCKMKKMHKYAKEKIFLYFFVINEIWNQINDSTTPKHCNHSQSVAKQGTKVKDT